MINTTSIHIILSLSIETRDHLGIDKRPDHFLITVWNFSEDLFTVRPEYESIKERFSLDTDQL